MDKHQLDLDDRKIEDAALAILYLSFDKDTGRVWKSLDWILVINFFNAVSLVIRKLEVNQLS